MLLIHDIFLSLGSVVLRHLGTVRVDGTNFFMLLNPAYYMNFSLFKNNSSPRHWDYKLPRFGHFVTKLFGSKRDTSVAFVRRNIPIRRMMMVFSYLISALMGFLFFSSTIGMFELLSSFASMPCKMSTPPQKAIVFNRTIAGEFSWLYSFPRSAKKFTHLFVECFWYCLKNRRKLIAVRYS